MSLYAIGDLHLHYQSVLKAPGQLHGRVWKNHEEKFRKNCAKTVTPEDTLVLVGDHSWGKNLSECERDLQYIRELPGRKILTRGNHDMFWDVKKTGMLNELYWPELTFVQDSYDSYQDYAIVATKGFTFEGPFYIDILEERSGFTDMAEEYGAEQVIYAHSHGESRFHDSIHGEYRGREYHLVSGDYLRWKPLKVLE